eukprot:UN24793
MLDRSLFMLIGLLLSCVSSKVITGSDWFSEDWSYLTRFCFAANGGVVQFDVITPSGEFVVFGMYFDTEDSWYNLNDDDDCATKQDKAKATAVFSENYAEQSTRFHSKRDRWWFFTVSNCQTRNVNMEYFRVEFTNPGGFFRRQFGADQWYIPEMTIVFLEQVL